MWHEMQSFELGPLHCLQEKSHGTHFLLDLRYPSGQVELHVYVVVELLKSNQPKKK